ncbi:unnamed protein product [Adineta steineri]|uniref:G-protein coupled receptors family 1 profile domain-containing protein n=1 Tax=Adineta steineri TaxID=433720 RepID=A0A818PSI6_9BILA|nr:unnamed protein product [Adineta steineri]CAF3630041.1 unnamed protein product [Adineta steineri]
MSSVPFSLSLSQNISIYGYICTFTLGLIGHSCSLLTFSQRQLRSVSTSLLFLIITTSDILFLLMSLYDFLLINIGIPQLSPYYIPLCRFRTFILNFTQTTSAWLLVCTGIDRLIRARLPHQTKRWCTRKNVIIVSVIIILFSIAFNSHVLQQSFGVALPFSLVICGPSLFITSEYSTFYYITWSPLQIGVNILIPALLMVICILGIYQQIRSTGHVRRNQNLQNQMILLMFTKIILFLICTLPYGVYRMATVNTVDPNKAVPYSIFMFVTAILTILLNANYSLTFYLNCLTSSLFRQTLIKTVKNYVLRRNVVQPFVSGTEQ